MKTRAQRFEHLAWVFSQFPLQCSLTYTCVRLKPREAQWSSTWYNLRCKNDSIIHLVTPPSTEKHCIKSRDDHQAQWSNLPPCVSLAPCPFPNLRMENTEAIKCPFIFTLSPNKWQNNRVAQVHKYTCQDTIIREMIR